MTRISRWGGCLLALLLAACPSSGPAPLVPPTPSAPTPAPPSDDPADWPAAGPACDLQADFASPYFPAAEPIVFGVACTGALADADAVITALKLPPGASFDEAARRLTWTPGLSEVGPADAVFGIVPSQVPDAVPEASTITVWVEYVALDVPPVLWIEVWDDIPQDAKIDGTLEVIEDHDGSLLGLDARPRSYEGLIGIGIRGRTSSGFPKKSYGLEIRDEDGEDLDVSLLGMPPESDWVLHGPYSDKSFLRNLLTYTLGAQMGRWQPRTRLTEVFIDGQYRGVYLVTEKIKRGSDRVAIPRPAATQADGDITGGYIFKREGSGEDRGWTSDSGIVWDHHYPRDDEITSEQEAYLHGWVDDFEAVMLGPDFADAQDGYRAWIDVDSWVDFAIMQELVRNIDGYKKSSYYFKEADKDGGRLFMGPLWDFNISFGNVDYCDGWLTAGLVYQTNWCFNYPDNYTPWWESLLMEEPWFASQMRCRWEELREDVLSMDNIGAIIDRSVVLLADAEPRDHELWDTLGTDLWPNFYVGDTYQDEVDYLREWIDLRTQWLDEGLPGTCP